ncbi:hypothetical protein FBU30_004729 [Linnemannia zychae]|nr:hypothetical protein FBU30_004729 [Linnemannia zychae]
MPHGPGTSSSKPSSPTQLRLPFLQESTPTTTAGITGLVEKAKMLLEASIMQGVTHHAFLADPSVIFVQSDQTDRGWGCGYRNIQMMLSYVVSQVNSSLTAKDTTVPVTGIPTIPELQRQLEYAWMNGFDVQGANQLSHKVEGTKKWIGTTEAWSIFCSLGIRCNILDFHMPSGPNGTHPAMFAAVYDYFTAPNWSPLSAPATFPVDYVRQRGNENRVIQTAKPPLYMQHQGHSRTIIGIEVLRESQEVNLLVFDPGRWVHKTIPTLSRSAISQSLLPSSGSKVVADDKKLDCQYLLKAFRLQVGAGFAKAQYQLLGISGLYSEMGDRSIDTELSCRSSPSSSSLLTPLQLFTRHPSLSIGWTEEEYENSKSVTSTRVPRYINTEKPLYFSVTKSNTKEALTSKERITAKMLSADRQGVKHIDKLSASNKAGSTIITASGASSPKLISPVSAAAAAAAEANAPRNKVFTVRPITSWIDKLAQQHGSPTSTSAQENADPNKKYSERDLVLKTMQDSYTEIILPFAKDKALLEEYINFGGTVRHGKIMEDLDALAGAISYKHCDDGKPDSSPLTIVTASVDRIDFLKPFDVTDLRLSGHVTYVGYSSMEVFMKMEEINTDKPNEHGDTILVARFTMVARDALTNKAAQVNPLLLQNDAEKKLFQMGEENKARKRLAADAALTKRPPTQDERFLIHDLYLEYSKYDNPQLKTQKPDDVEWMADTKMSAIQIMQPQDRNIHDKIFGGYLMRLAYELAFCNASVFIQYRPTFLALDEISFRKPVPIGTFLQLDSQIAFSEGGDHHSFQVMVKADVLDIRSGTRETTNHFWFTFRDPKRGNAEYVTPKVMPRTYAESMLYIEGKRRRMEGTKMAHLNRKNLGLE